MLPDTDDEVGGSTTEARNQVWTRVLHWLVYANNILLLPMFTVLLVEAASSQSADVFASVNLFFCGMFFAEWLLGLALSDHRVAYLRNPSNLADLLFSIPVSAFAQGLRVVRLLRLLRLVRLATRVRRFQGKGATMVRAFGLFGALVVTGALAFRIVEPQSTDGLEAALWWSLVTLSTVGYGDIAPVTPGGHVIAGLLIIAGIGTFGYMAGFMTSLLEDPEEDEILEVVKRLEVQIVEMQAMLAAGLPRSP